MERAPDCGAPISPRSGLGHCSKSLEGISPNHAGPRSFPKVFHLAVRKNLPLGSFLTFDWSRRRLMTLALNNSEMRHWEQFLRQTVDVRCCPRCTLLISLEVAIANLSFLSKGSLGR